MYDIEKYYNAGTVSEAVTLLNEHPDTRIISGAVSYTHLKLAADALENANYQKNSKKAGKRKEEKSPLLDCLSKEDVSERKEFTVHKRVCGNCADVCPNRANVLIEVPAVSYTHLDVYKRQMESCQKQQKWICRMLLISR